MRTLCMKAFLCLERPFLGLVLQTLCPKDRGRSLFADLWLRDKLGDILRDNLGEGNCESKVVTRQWGA